MPIPISTDVSQLDRLRNVRVDEAMLAKAVDTFGDLAVNLVVAALILTITIWLSRWISRGVQRALGRIHRDNPDPTLQSFGGSMARYLVIIVGLVAVLSQLGVQTTSILAVLGAASLAIGLALQGALSNVAAGVMILLFRPYRIGDLVEIGTRKGVVRNLDLFLTELATLDNLRVIVPNSKAFGDVIVNYSTHSRRRVEAVFKLPFATDVNQVVAGLTARIAGDPRVRKDPAPTVEITDMAHDSFQVTARCWVAREDEPFIKAELLLAARLLAQDPDAALPAYAPTRRNSKAKEPPEHGLRLLNRRRARKEEPKA
jgi:small conductance mechanosensitive channel